MITLAIIGALLIGLTLGLLGSGGSVFMLPLLIFILQRPEKLAIAESLAIIGAITFLGSIPYAIYHQIHWNSVLFFGLPGVLGACIGGNCAYYISGSVQLILFALVMLLIASIMLLGFPSFEKFSSFQQVIGMIIFQGFLIGTLTGLIGVGGGFIIVPALMILKNLSMSFAVGTSLFIIAMNSFTGFIQHLISLRDLNLLIDWKMILLLSFLGALGACLGSLLSKQFSSFYLKKLFGLSVLVMSVYILVSRF